MRLPENIDITTVIVFDQNHALVFDTDEEDIAPTSWEVDESHETQEIINGDHDMIEAWYNNYASAHNAYADSMEVIEEPGAFITKSAAMVSQELRDTYFHAFVGPKTVQAFVTRVVFTEIVQKLYDEDPNHADTVDFELLTSTCELPYTYYPDIFGDWYGFNGDHSEDEDL